MGTCVFCAVAAGESARSLVYEDDLVVGFMDIYPVNPGHMLVAPKRHAASLGDLPLPTGCRMMEVAVGLAEAIQASALQSEGLTLFLADGEAAGQEIFHIHLHVIPRFRGDGFTLRIAYDRAPSRAGLDEHAAIITAALTDAAD